MTHQLSNALLTLTIGQTDELFSVQCKDHPAIIALAAPIYEVEGRPVGGTVWRYQSQLDQRTLANGGLETRVAFALPSENLTLELSVQQFPDSPFVRWRYALSAASPVKLTKTEGLDAIAYTGLQLAEPAALTEIQFSQFDSIAHTFLPCFQSITAAEVRQGISLPGPILMMQGKDHACLLAYEHGAEYPDSYLTFDVRGESGMFATLRARRGNYYDGQQIGPEKPLVSPWFHMALCEGGQEELLAHYRTFFLRCISEHTESRKPYIFYNTWHGQERDKYYRGLPYLHSMHLEHILQEIDIAGRMGVDVFVIDTGWFSKTGDWLVNLQRFPDGLRQVRQALEERGMRLGLWLAPMAAAVTSKVVVEHPEYRMQYNGKDGFLGPIWETEDSWGMCLASGYADALIDGMQRIHDELGVVYFKLDGTYQYGCDSPLHGHGGPGNSSQEREECYSFQQGMALTRIAEEVCRRCPDSIVDFDITEGSRYVGLGFLSGGKYFLINNGPYFSDFDIPKEFRREPDTINVFFHPGAARGRVCRQGLRYDRFVPSILFLTHFLPDGPAKARRNALASLVLGGNGIWGDLLSLTPEDIAHFGETLTHYKKVAQCVTESPVRTKGFVGASPEIYEKIDGRQGKGLVCFFNRKDGSYEYLTKPIDRSRVATVVGADHVEWTDDNRLRLTVELEEDDARIIFIL